MNLKIRPMHELDINRVYDIERSAHITPWSREIIHDCVRIGYDCRVLEQCEGETEAIIGYIISRLYRREYHILNLCIGTTMQSKGIGKQFLTRVLNSLEQNKMIASVTLEVRTSNTIALKLYKNLGFEQDQVKENYYNDGDKSENAIVLKKTIIQPTL